MLDPVAVDIALAIVSAFVFGGAVGVYLGRDGL